MTKKTETTITLSAQENAHAALSAALVTVAEERASLLDEDARRLHAEARDLEAKAAALRLQAGQREQEAHKGRELARGIQAEHLQAVADGRAETKGGRVRSVDVKARAMVVICEEEPPEGE